MSALEQLVDEIAEKVAERLLPRILEAFGSREDGAVEIIAEFATRYGWSKRHVTTLVARGLPTVGEGRARRIRSRAADAWLIGAGERPANTVTEDDESAAITALAVRHARRGASR